MTPEQNRRISAVKLADAINKIEGVPVTEKTQQLSYKWARGEISGKELKSNIIKAHYRPLNKVL